MTKSWMTGLIGVVIGLIVAGGGEYFYLRPRLAKAAVSQQETSQSVTPAPTSSSAQGTQQQGAGSTSQNAATGATTSPTTQVTAKTLTAGVVTQINGSTLTVASNGNFYNVSTKGSTKFLMGNASASSLSQLSVNDLVDVTGVFNGFNISATQIRDISLATQTFTGTIVSIDLNNNNNLVVNEPSGNQTVTITSATLITDKNGKGTALPNLNVGDTVSVFGLWDTATNTVVRANSVKDFNIAV